MSKDEAAELKNALHDLFTQNHEEGLQPKDLYPKVYEMVNNIPVGPNFRMP